MILIFTQNIEKEKGERKTERVREEIKIKWKYEGERVMKRE